MADMAGLFEMSYFGPVKEVGLADYDMFWGGPWLETNGIPLDWLLFQKCLEYQPHVIYIYGWWLDPDDRLKASHFALFTFYLIRKLLNIKIVTLVFDQGPSNFKTSDNLARFCDFVFTHEHESLFRNNSYNPEKHMVTHATFSPKLFHGDPLAHREIGLAFAGGIGGYSSDRANGLRALRASGLTVTAPGGRGEGQPRLANEEYANFFKGSKIVVNWSRHISGKWFQAKARIFEATLAGAMLLCEECDPVNRWFEPYVDYIPFSSTEELLQLARYYLDRDEERLKIAIHGNQTALSKYSADVMWSEMVAQMRETSFYREEEAVEGLRRNASSNELKVARFFQRELNQLPRFDQLVIEEAVAIVEEGNKSLARRVQWQVDRLIWRKRRLRGLHWIILRKLLPAIVTRKRLRSGFASLARRLSH